MIHWSESLETLKADFRHVTLSELVFEQCSESVSRRFDDLVRQAVGSQRLRVDILALDGVADSLSAKGVSRAAIQSYCERHFQGKSWLLIDYFLEALFYLDSAEKPDA